MASALDIAKNKLSEGQFKTFFESPRIGSHGFKEVLEWTYHNPNGSEETLWVPLKTKEKQPLQASRVKNNIHNKCTSLLKKQLVAPQISIHARSQPTHQSGAPSEHANCRKASHQDPSRRALPRPTKRRLVVRDEDDSNASSGTADALEAETNESVYDHYHGVAKISHRHEFAVNCAFMANQSPNRDVLYLETSAGMTTQALLANGFVEKDLHPCNLNSEELNRLTEKYPGVVGHNGDILEEYKRQRSWLGIWFDLETSLLKRDLPTQPWDRSRVPAFSRAVVCAMSLGHRGVRGTTEQFAIELQALMQSDPGFVTSPQMARAYSGRSNKQNMVFALAHYQLYTWRPRDYLYQRVHIPLDYYGKFERMENYMQVNGRLVATVTRVARDGEALHLTFQSKEGYFFEHEDTDLPMAPRVLEPWIV